MIEHLNKATKRRMYCPICDGSMNYCFSAQVLHKYLADFDVCSECGFMRVKDPHWLAESYSRAIALADTGLVTRNISFARRLSSVLFWINGERGEGRYLDTAGGYGLLVRLMRDSGFDFFWSDRYCENILAEGFELRDQASSYSAVTALEVMEHLIDPREFVEQALELSGAPILFFTTELYRGSPPAPDAWWYYAFATGQHIAFYKRKTLSVLAAKLKLSFASANGFHVFSKRRMSERLLAVATNPIIAISTQAWIRRRLGSKTQSDHEMMLGKVG